MAASSNGGKDDIVTSNQKALKKPKASNEGMINRNYERTPRY